MSKNVKFNNKNTKKPASKSKKSTRNIYKIESLEPRLMMDAEPLDSALEPNLDMEQFDSYVEQISNLSDSIGEKAVESLGQFDKIDFTQFHLADKANAAVEFVSDSVEQLKSEFTDKLNNTLGKAFTELEKKFYAGEVALEEGKIKLADFVQNYVATKTEGTGLTFTVEGSKLVISYNLDYAKNITDMGFDLAAEKFELTSEGTALNTSAKYPEKVHFCHNLTWQLNYICSQTFVYGVLMSYTQNFLKPSPKSKTDHKGLMRKNPS